MEKNLNAKKFFKRKNKALQKNKLIKIISYIIFVIIILYIIISIIKLNIYYSKIMKILKYNNILPNDLNDKNSVDEIFDEKIKKKYMDNQINFCNSNDLFLDIDMENKIKKVNAHLNGISFNMFVYKENDVVSKFISSSGNWEAKSTNDLIKCLDYYSQKKKLSKNEITIIDIGANVGWYSFFFAKAGYELISFEVSHMNGYILKKIFV